MMEAGASRAPAERDHLELLTEHAPRLQYDPQDQLRVLSAEAMLSNPGNLLLDGDGDTVARAAPGAPSLDFGLLDAYELRPGAEDERLAQAPGWIADARRMQAPEHPLSGRIYGKVVEGDDGSAWLVYWLFYYFNPKNLQGLGKHEGDWEMVQIWVDPQGSPRRVTYAQHEFGEARTWDEIESDGGHPLVHVGQLSHASYFARGSYPYAVGLRWLGVGIDHALGGAIPGEPHGPSETPAVELLPERGWPLWPGRWGSNERKVLGRVGDGPGSPGRQEPKWSRPDDFDRAQGKVVRFLLRLTGRLVHLVGRRTYPETPVIDAAERTGADVTIAFSAQAKRLHRTKYVLLTVNEAEGAQLVLASRTVRPRKSPGPQTLRVPESAGALRVWASAFNGPRQRSDLTSRVVS